MRAFAAVVVVAGFMVGPGAGSALASFSIVDVTPTVATEGTSFTVKVRRDHALPVLAPAASVEVVIGAQGDTASAGSDYVLPADRVLDWGAGQTGEMQLLVSTTDDSVFEGTESVTFALANPNPANEPISGLAQITRHIGDNEPQPTISVGNASVVEGTGANPTVMTFPVTLSAATTTEVSAGYSTGGGTATADQDYTPATGTVRIPAGQTQGSITVNVTADEAIEPDETFELTLANPTGAPIAGTGVATGTITNDDFAPTLAISGPEPQKEGTGTLTPFQFVITLSRAQSQPVTISYATNDGTATAPADYVDTEQTLTFAPGETQKVVTVNVNGDGAVETNENFSVSLSVESAGGIVATTGSVTATILDDDGPNAPPPPANTGVLGNQTAADTTPPKVKLSKITSSRGVVRVTVTCPVGESVCRGTMSVFNIPKRSSKVKALRGEVKLASSLFVIKGGERVRLTMRPTKRAASLIRRARTLRARGYAVARDAAGNIATVRTTGTVKAAR